MSGGGNCNGRCTEVFRFTDISKLRAKICCEFFWRLGSRVYCQYCVCFVVYKVHKYGVDWFRVFGQKGNGCYN